jgi:hypothetical protein
MKGTATAPVSKSTRNADIGPGCLNQPGPRYRPTVRIITRVCEPEKHVSVVGFAPCQQPSRFRTYRKWDGESVRPDSPLNVRVAGRRLNRKG